MKEIGYHGTTMENARKILDDNFNIFKNGKYKYWLGEGVYFFLDDIYAFKWCVHEYHKLFNKDFPPEDDGKMAIIEVFLECEDDRVLDLTLFRGQLLIDKVYLQMLHSKKYVSILQKNEDNKVSIVIDYLFKKLDFGKDYDIVKQVFRVNIKNYFKFALPREQGLPQAQICVKNIDVIKEKKLFEYSHKIEDYITQWNALVGTTPFIKIVQENGLKSLKIEYIDKRKNKR